MYCVGPYLECIFPCVAMPGFLLFCELCVCVFNKNIDIHAISIQIILSCVENNGLVCAL